MLPGMGGPDGRTARQIVANFRDGFRCTFDATAPGRSCGFENAGKLIDRKKHTSELRHKD